MAPTRLWGAWHLVSILAPFFVTVVIPLNVATNEFSRADRDSPAFVQSSHSVIALRILGALDFLALVIGIPWGVAKFGAAGFLACVAVVLILSGIISLSCVLILRSQGESWKSALRAAMSFLSPFAAPFAGETIQSTRMRKYPRLTVLHGLLGEVRFRALVRRSVYDLESDAPSSGNGWLDQLALSVPKNERAKIINSAPPDCSEHERYCPRCGEKYLLESAFCVECNGVPLSAAGAR